VRAKAILETVLYAPDPATCAAFYREVFGLEELRAQPGRFNFLRCGTQMLLLFAPQASADPAQQNGIPGHGAQGPGHVCFGVATGDELEDWQRHLAASGIGIEHCHRWPGGGRSLYLRDPAGNSVEIAETRIWPGLGGGGEIS
jgi:catechol 2,3-dioxygenase-like lactoylglutathione lyase family enzyme